MKSLDNKQQKSIRFPLMAAVWIHSEAIDTIAVFQIRSYLELYVP